jgi:hypothetical protein
MEQTTILEDLGDGLILRRSTPADAEALPEFVAHAFGDPRTGEPQLGLGAWARELLGGGHPTFGTGDFTVVEEARTGRIVSSLNLISQTWSYGGVEFGVGRPELVVTLPEFRRRGLVRRQMEVIHRWSAERGQMMQAITGIPWYYRQFGYEMAITLGGARYGYGPNVPKLKEGEDEPFHFRPAREEDLPFVANLYDLGRARYRVSCVRDAAMWRRELTTPANSEARRELVVIETAGGQPVGLLIHPPILWGGVAVANWYEVGPGTSWLAVTPAVMRYLWAAGQDIGARQGKPLDAFAFMLGPEHPAYVAAGSHLVRTRPPYAYYVRVPDLPVFLRHVAPALEQSLAGSPAAGHSGELELSFYRSGLRLVLEAGRLADVQPWDPPFVEAGDAHFPGLTFLQLLFGYRSLEELRYAFPDCWAGDEAIPVLAGLFPKQVSNVWPVS